MERNNDIPKGYYRLANNKVLRAVKKYFKEKLSKDCWKDMRRYFFVNYNNGYEKTYTMYEIDKTYDDFNWRKFVNNIPTTRITGCCDSHFQKALQEEGIPFIVHYTMNQSRYDDWMSIEFNRKNIFTIEHDNIGNY